MKGKSGGWWPIALVALVCGAWTFHRSFTHRDADLGLAANLSVPVDSRGAEAIGEGRKKQANKELSIFGKVTRVSDGDTIWVTVEVRSDELGVRSERVKVRLDRIDAPEKDQPFGKESTEYLKRLIYGKEVEVRYTQRDKYGRVLGEVRSKSEEGKSEDVNLLMVREGMAWHYSHFDKTPAYAEAEREARQARRGLWSADNPINPYDWRKSKRKM